MSHLAQIADEDYDRYYANTTFLLNGSRLVYYRGANEYFDSDGRLGGAGGNYQEIPRKAVKTIELPRIGYYKDCYGTYASRIPLRSTHKGLCSQNVTLTRDADISKAMSRARITMPAVDFVFVPAEYIPWQSAIEQVLRGDRLHAILDIDTAVVASYQVGNPRIKHKGVAIGEVLPSGKIVAYKGAASIFKHAEGLSGIDFTTDWSTEVQSPPDSGDAAGVQFASTAEAGT